MGAGRIRRVAWRRVLTITAMLALLGGALVVGAPVARADAVLPPAAEIEAQFVGLINDTRLQAGAEPLVVDPALSDTARLWSAVMQSNGTLSHDPNLAAVIEGVDPTWQAAAENVGTGFDVVGLYEAFLASASHYVNLVGDYNRLGLGVVVDGGRIWVTMRFLLGTPLTPPPPIDPPPAGTDAWFHPLPPSRLLDTRDGTGLSAGALPLGPGGSVQLDVTGVGGVPADGVSAVLVNVTATGATATTHLTVHPSGTARPPSSNLNVAAGETVANMVDARVGSDGRITVYNNSGSVHVVVDVAGYWDATASGGTRFSGVDPHRVMDTRDGTGVPAGAVGPQGTRSVVVTGLGGVPASGVGAVALSVTAVNGSATSHVTVWPGGTTMPLASSLNFPAGRTVPNLVVVPVGGGGAISLLNNAGTVDLVVDVLGWFGTGAAGAHTPITPSRLRDTRFGPGAVGKVGPGGEVVVDVAGVAGLPAGADAVVLNVTALNATAPTHVTAYPGGTALPTASNVNLTPGQVKPVLVMVRVGSDGTVRLRNNAGAVDLVVDAFASFDDGA